jgi:hypothetical protein
MSQLVIQVVLNRSVWIVTVNLPWLQLVLVTSNSNDWEQGVDREVTVRGPVSPLLCEIKSIETGYVL